MILPARLVLISVFIVASHWRLEWLWYCKGQST